MNIYYLKHGRRADEQKFKERFTAYQEHIERFISGEAHGLSVEKLRGGYNPPVWSLRCSLEVRILFTKYRDGYLFLDVLEHHEYNQSRFLQHGILGRYLQQLDLIEFEEASAAEILPPQDSRQTLSFAAMKPVVEYHQQWLCLTDAQEKVINVALPAIVYGPAGSGKTSTGFLALKKYVDEHQGQDEFFPICYVSQSRGLVDELREDWVRQSGSMEGIFFRCIDDFFSTEDAFNQDQQKEIFISWYKGIDTKSKDKIPADFVWKEFRICSGHSKASYIALGTHDILVDQARLPALYDIYELFISHLNKTGQSLALFADFSERAGTFATLLVDEAQDLSTKQLKQLFHLSRENKVLFCLGDHQILAGGRSCLSFLKNTLGIHTLLRLDQTHRCAQAIVSVANMITQMKLAVVGGTADKMEQISLASSGTEQGSFEWHSLSHSSDIPPELQTDAGCAIIISNPTLREEAEARFQTPLVFTVAEAKGLEFPTVVLYQFLSNSPNITEVNKKIPDTLERTSGGRAKAGREDTTHLDFFNMWYTAVTRARRKIVMIEEKSFQHNISRITQHLSTEEKAGAAAVMATPEEDHTQDWIKTFKILLANLNLKQAWSIYEKKLKPAGYTLTKREASAYGTLQDTAKQKKAMTVPSPEHVRGSGAASQTRETQHESNEKKAMTVPSPEHARGSGAASQMRETQHESNERVTLATLLSIEKSDIVVDEQESEAIQRTIKRYFECLDDYENIFAYEGVNLVLAWHTHDIYPDVKMFLECNPEYLQRILCYHKNGSYPGLQVTIMTHPDLIVKNKFFHLPEFIEGLCGNYLRKTKQQGCPSNSSLLFNLCTNRAFIFEMFISAYPEILQKIPAEALCTLVDQHLDSRSGPINNMPVFFKICDEPDLLTCILKQEPQYIEAFVSKISPAALFTVMSHRIFHSITTGFTAFEKLCTSSNGINLLFRIFKSQPTLWAKIDSNVLCRKNKDGTPPLSYLCSEQLGRMFLSVWMRNDPTLPQKITRDTLCAPIATDEVEKPRVLDCLIQHRRNFEALLSGLQKEYPDLFLGVSSPQLSGSGFFAASSTQTCSPKNVGTIHDPSP